MVSYFLTGKKRKNTKVAWSNEEKKIVRERFADYIKKERIPSTAEIK